MGRKKKKKIIRGGEVKKNIPVIELEYLDLVNIVRSRGRVKKEKINEAYNEIIYRIKPRIMYIVSQFNVPGNSSDDIYQEALYALRYKAIPDYDKTRGQNGPYPFDNFAVLCIRRHLSTLLKSSFQNKKKVLNTSYSLNQNNNSNSDEGDLFLVDILSKNSKDILDGLETKEYYKELFGKLFKRLSSFEKKIFVLYTKKYSYEEITALTNKYYKENSKKKRINIKSVDNALSRIKQKAKEIFEKNQD